jgi:tetratricopeptide (TPR) repeat protein
MPSSPQSISQSLRDAGQEVLAHLANFLPFVGAWRARRANHYFELAEKSYSEEKLTDAIPHLRKALEWSAVKGVAYESLGMVYYELGDPNNAKSNLMLAILDNFKQGVTSSLRALKSIAIIFHQEGDLTEAMYYYLKALEVPGGPSDDPC